MAAFCFILGLLAVASVADARLRVLPRTVATVAPKTDPNVKAANISLPIDHFNAADNRTFLNHYYFNSAYYSPGGPIIIYDCGESTADPVSAQYVLGNDVSPFSPALELAKSHHGLVIYWEHRYYGASQPCPTSSGFLANVSADCSYQFHTIDQALEDVVYFAHHPNFPGLIEHGNGTASESMAADQTPWIFLGGSYPGARAAWLRVRNPETIFAAWASSAVVNTIPDGSAYFNTQMRSQPANCTADINAATRYMDSVFDSANATAIADLTERIIYTQDSMADGFFNASRDGEQSEPADLIGFAENLVGIFFQSHGPVNSSDKVCGNLEHFNVSAVPDNANISTILANPGDGVPSPSGLVGAGVPLHTIADAYLYAVAKWYKNRAAKPTFNVTNSSNPDIISSSPLPSSSQSPSPLPSSNQTSDPASATHPDSGLDTTNVAFNFDYQTLTQLGALQAWTPTYAHLQPNRTLLSHFTNYTRLRAHYIASYPGISPSLIPPVPDTSACTKYGGWSMAPSNTMFTVGEYDPWRPFTVFGVDEELEGAPRPPRSVTGTVPRCGEVPGGGEGGKGGGDVFGIVYAGMAHAADGSFGNLGAGDYSASRAGFELFDRALGEWLPCFKAKSGNATG